jgi:hypothetical protein
MTGLARPAAERAAGRASHEAALTASHRYRLASCGGASRKIFAKSFPDLRIGSYTSRTAPDATPVTAASEPDPSVPPAASRQKRPRKGKRDLDIGLFEKMAIETPVERGECNTWQSAIVVPSRARALLIVELFLAGQVFRANVSARHSSRSIPPPGSSRAPRFPPARTAVLELRGSRAVELFDALRRVGALEPPRRDVVDLDLLDLLALVRRPLVCDLRAIIPPNTWMTAGRRLGPPGSIQAARYGPHALGKNTREKIKKV